MRKRVALAVLVALTAGSVFAARNELGESTTSGAKLKIAGIIFQEDQFFRMLSFGMRDAAGKAGAEFLLGNSMNKPDKEIQLLDSYVAQKVDAIAISPISEKSSAAGINRAAQKGIRIIMTNSTIPGKAPATFIESNQKELGTRTGQAARKYIEEKLGGKAKIAILAYKSLLPEQSNARVDGFKEEVTRLPGVEIVTEQDAWLPEAAVKKAGDIITAHSEINLIWSANEGGTVGSVLAVKNAGRAGKIAVFGTDVSLQLLDFLDSGDDILQAITAQQPYEIGTTAVESALKVLRGDKVEAKITLGGVTMQRSDPTGVKVAREKLQSVIGKGDK